MMSGKRFLTSVLLVCAAMAAATPASARTNGYTKSTYLVPVTQPDELGRPVTIDTDVYVPKAPAPRRGFPLIEVFHGGGSDKTNAYDSGHAAFFAQHGYVAILYSQRGNGGSSGQETVAGPKEMHDLFDVTAWALGIGGRSLPAHPSFHLDRARIGLTGYSQGGLNTNLGQVWSSDPAIDPYRIRFAALEPGNTPDLTFNALVPHGVVKLSFGVGLLETYFVGTKAQMEPEMYRWIATAVADQPQLYGGPVCDAGGHDTPASTMKEDLAARSPGCFMGRMTPPSLWSQAFDDNLFPPDMAISMWRQMPDHTDNRLYLSMGGHAAPSAAPAVEQDRLNQQLRFFDHFLYGARLTAPRVVYWTRDPSVAVPSNAYRYPSGAWFRQTAPTWPPPGTVDSTYELGADGRAVGGDAKEGSLPLQPVAEDERDDPVTAAAMSATPVGTSPVPGALPATNVPGFVASFATAPFAVSRALTGAPAASLTWTPLSPDTQLVLEVFDQAPDGTLTLLSRGVDGLRGATAGVSEAVSVPGNAFSAEIRAGHRIVAWVLDGDAAFYKPYPDSGGGVLQAGRESTLTLPLR
jgi:X-Pro dipeptidyl-peptidase C-terminal non-catalytic domain/X-Pro dipeptidyl-peptidase (S15 family)